jgi:hypothetical protein
MSPIASLEPPRDAVTSEERAWKKHAGQLAEHAMKHLVNRPDTHGVYFRDDAGNYRSSRSKKTLDLSKLRRHFKGERIIGLYTTSATDQCRWLAIDIDCHEGDPDDFEIRNHDYARRLYEQLCTFGFDPLLYDSNGRGGRHLFVIFDQPQAAPLVRRFGRWLVRDWQEHGFLSMPEVFPKQDTIIKVGQPRFGNFVRLAGKHPKRPHWMKVWDGETWRAGEEAIRLILDHTGDSSSLVPQEALEYEPVREAKKPRPAKDWKRFPRDLASLDIAGLFESRGLRNEDKGGGQLEVECPWATQHTTGSETAYVQVAVPESGFPPRFYCHHSHCEGRDFRDVLEFFGKEEVTQFCGQKGKPTAASVIDRHDFMGTARRFQGGTKGRHLRRYGEEWYQWTGREY